jgi:hypothetical protein
LQDEENAASRRHSSNPTPRRILLTKYWQGFTNLKDFSQRFAAPEPKLNQMKK